MRRLLLLAAAVLVAAPAAAADLPVVVFQTKPVGAVLDDIRAGAKLIGGPDLVKQFDESLKKDFGDKGLDGIDKTKPVVGYMHLDFAAAKTKKPENVPFVFALPVTSEEAFLDMVNRLGKKDGERATPVPGKKGYYRLAGGSTTTFSSDKTVPPKTVEGEPTIVRVHAGYAYFAQNPHREHLDDGKLVTADKLTTPGETALFAAKMYFDRLPEDVRKEFAEGVDKAIAELKNQSLLKDEQFKELSAEAEKKLKQMVTRWLSQAKEAKEATFRVVFDPKTGEAGMEFALAARPGTSLAKDLASWKPNTNRFAGLVSKDAAAGALWTLPFINQEVREFFALAMEAGAKKGAEESNAPDFAKPLLKEVSDGMVRTVRAGNVDVGAALTGPDKDGLFTAVAAFSFEDPSKIEKELRTLVAEQAPPDVRNLIKFDAAKAGSVGVHKITVPPGQLPPEAAKLFGESAAVAVAFAPKGVYVAFGPDPVATLRTAVALEPQTARMIEVRINPAKVGKVADALGGPMGAAKAAEILGDKDDLYTVLYVGLDGGTELRMQVGVNVKLAWGLAPKPTAGEFKPVGSGLKPAPEKKDK